MLRLAGIAYYAALAVFVVLYVRRLDFTVLAGWTVDLRFLAAATVFALAYRAWGVFTWTEMLRGLGARITSPPAEIAYVYAKAWMGRYLPGKVTWILGKVWFGAGLGISPERLAVGALVEATQQIAITMLLALALLGLDPRLDVFSTAQRGALVAGAVALLLMMHPRLFNWAISQARGLLRRPTGEAVAVVRGATLFYGAGLQTVAFLITGLSYFLLARAVDATLSVSHLPFIIGTFNLAGAIGILAVFAPSGLGVREGVQLLLLPLVMPAELALVLTAVTRLWSTGVDLLFFALTQLLRRRHSATEP